MNKKGHNFKSCGIIGLGFVGLAIRNTLEKEISVETFDIEIKSTCKTLEEINNRCEVIFLCLPTPMNEDGNCNFTILEKIVSDINNLQEVKKNQKYIIIKSTIPVGTSSYLQSRYTNISIIFNPEFLTEANSYNDFANQDRIILGGDKNNTKLLKCFYRDFFPSIPIMLTTFETAELAKYLTNTFLATKVSFANEIYDFCQTVSVDYSELIEIACHDSRLSNSHWQVPGPDGARGYGGSCFPKDIGSLINQFKDKNLKSYILNASYDRNNELDRTNKDWKKLKGRSVVKKSV
jgi:UDPglucose 6-dehydrogenase